MCALTRILFYVTSVRIRVFIRYCSTLDRNIKYLGSYSTYSRAFRDRTLYLYYEGGGKKVWRFKNGQVISQSRKISWNDAYEETEDLLYALGIADQCNYTFFSRNLKSNLKTHSGRPNEVDDDQIKAIIEADHHVTVPFNKTHQRLWFAS